MSGLDSIFIHVFFSSHTIFDLNVLITFEISLHFSLLFMVPTACSIFPQQCSLDVKTIQRFEPEVHAAMREKSGGKLPQKVYFNKGL